MSVEKHVHGDLTTHESSRPGASGLNPAGPANPYLAQPRPTTPKPSELGVEELTTAECWRLVEACDLGRLALDAADGRPDVFPINYLVHNGNLFLRSAPGTKLRSIAQNPAVAFEVDGADDRFHWSVVIRANADRMDTDSEIEASGVLDLVSASPTEKFDFVRLTPVAVTGRRFPRRTPSRAESAAAEAADPSTPQAPVDGPAAKEDDKPLSIPHFAPLPH